MILHKFDYCKCCWELGKKMIWEYLWRLWILRVCASFFINYSSLAWKITISCLSFSGYWIFSATKFANWSKICPFYTSNGRSNPYLIIYTFYIIKVSSICLYWYSCTYTITLFVRSLLLNRFRLSKNGWIFNQSAQKKSIRIIPYIIYFPVNILMTWA